MQMNRSWDSCCEQQPRASLVPPCLSFPRLQRLFIHRELGNRLVWQREDPRG